MSHKTSRSASKRAPTAASKPKSAAAFRAQDIASLDYAQSVASSTPVRDFTHSVPLLSVEEQERAYLSSGIIFKGVNKKARDLFRKGFRIKLDVENRELEDKLNAQAREWMRQTGYLPKAIHSVRETFVFGSGFVELGFPEPRGTDPFTAPAKSAAPTAVYNVDPISLLPVKDPRTGEIMAYLCQKPGFALQNLPNSSIPQATYDPAQPSQAAPTVLPVRSLDRNMVRQWALGRGKLPEYVQAIHPERIQHFKFNAIRQNFDGLGISVIQAAYINALAKLAGDLVSGDVLEWYSKGFFVLNIENATPEELDDALRGLEAAKRARKNYFVGSERSKFDIKSPIISNIKQFYDNFHIELAGAMEMPVMVLLGVQTGTNGAETDLTQYYDDSHGFQTLHLEAPIVAMMRRVLGRSDFSIEFTPLYVNKQTEADIAFKRSQATSQLYSSKVLSRREAVRFMRNGELPNPDEIPEAYSTDSGPKAPAGPAADPAQPADDPNPEPAPDDGAAE